MVESIPFLHLGDGLFNPFLRGGLLGGGSLEAVKGEREDRAMNDGQLDYPQEICAGQ